MEEQTVPVKLRMDWDGDLPQSHVLKHAVIELVDMYRQMVGQDETSKLLWELSVYNE